MLLISLVVALLAALQLGDFFGASDEFGLVILVVMAFVPVVACRVRRDLCVHAKRSTDHLAWRLCSLAACVALMPAGAARPDPDAGRSLDQSLQSSAPRTVHHAGACGAGAARGAGAMGPGAAALAALASATMTSRGGPGSPALGRPRHPQPYGLAFLQGTLRARRRRRLHVGVHRHGDRMSSLAALLVMAWVECYIRDRMTEPAACNRRRCPSATLK